MRPHRSVLFAWLLALLLAPAWPCRAANEPLAVDFRYSPPEWQTSICLPDDPQKTLVDKSGELLYDYGRGQREFGARIGVDVTPAARWVGQKLVSPRVPVVRTLRSGGDWEIVEEAFAVTNLKEQSPSAEPTLTRLDSGGVNRAWASPPEGVDPSLADIAVHMGGNIHYQLAVAPGASRRVALALCEGWWNEPGRRIELLRVEGAAPKTVDTVADIGANKAGAFWFDASDANRDGKIDIGVDAAPQAKDKNTILNGLWVFPPDTPRDDAALLSGRLSAAAQARLNTAVPGGPSRNDIILVRLTNQANETRSVTPHLIVDTTRPCEIDRAAGRILVDGHETVTASLKMIGEPERRNTRQAIPLQQITLAPGRSASFFVLHSGGARIVLEPKTLKAAESCRKAAEAYWNQAPVPSGKVQVPDPEIQALVDSSIRNIWQAREVKNSLPVFQVGPTCYRGLWIVDGAFILESAAMLGAGKEARNGIAYTLAQQKPNGAFEVLSPHYYKENGIVLWTCVRHAMLTQDKPWLESVWPKLEAAADYIKRLRQLSLKDDTPLDDGLIPPGEIDGGLSGQGTGFKRPEFSNVHWNLLGLRAFIQGARWLGKANAAAQWQREYDDFYATFRQAAARDTRSDPHGNHYVPIFMANQGNELPQRAQWTFCHAVYPGQLFPQDDPLVSGTMAMLEATEREGMVYGTGWAATGIWNYFASFYGHAWLWLGNGRKAAQVLYAYANHAAPTLVWREEQSLKGERFRKVGDMPHNWASAEFIRLVIHLLALDRGNELHLLEALPPEWARPGMVTRLDGVATPFGPLYMQLRVNAAGDAATLEVKPLAANCQAVVVHEPGDRTTRLDPHKRARLTFALQ